MCGHIELYDKPLAWLSSRILGFMQSVWRNTDDIKCLDFVGYALDKVNGIWAQQYA